MSFGEYSSKWSAGGKGNEYQRLCDCISKNIQQINSNVTKIQQLVDKIGTSENVNIKLETTEKETQRLVKDTNSYLKQLVHLGGEDTTEKQRRKLQRERLTDNFSSALNNYQKVQRVAAEKERDYVSRARAASMGMGSGQTGGYNADPSLVDFDRTSGGGSASGGGLQIQSEEELSIEMIEERERAIRQLEADIVGVNEIFRDLANMVHEQGDVIDSIEANVESAAVHVETANVQLEKARDYQKASRKKLCCILIILVVVAGAIGLVVYLVVRPKNKS
ncbi:syntaxin-7 [Exaiptasia diaphana]|uniref:t-SNARE coiled-coil homology domain-containing protein n=1 Tax=Exaiptasia diaphana TaxID=2652724 RepID=A0A913XEF1_EXADI|nr:syntaxin-7 [Exaiptasia diaphana]KXJ12622.1 Syntaxin-7 [Exaiptasia diaphana]